MNIAGTGDDAFGVVQCPAQTTRQHCLPCSVAAVLQSTACVSHFMCVCICVLPSVTPPVCAVGLRGCGAVGLMTGYTKSSTSWSNNYVVVNSIQVFLLSSNTLDMRVHVDGKYPFRLLHTWAATTTTGGQPALAMNSTMFIGLQPWPDSTSSDDALVAPTMNQVAFK